MATHSLRGCFNRPEVSDGQFRVHLYRGTFSADSLHRYLLEVVPLYENAAVAYFLESTRYRTGYSIEEYFRNRPRCSFAPPGSYLTQSCQLLSCLVILLAKSHQ